MGPMARTVTDLAKMMDIMVQYDPEDPETALGAGHKPTSYLSLLDKNGLKGARIGVLRTDMGVNTNPNEADYKEVMAVFNQTVGELKAAGATVVDPIVIPGLNELQKFRASRPDVAEAALEAWLARNVNSPFHNRDDIAKAPNLDKSFPPAKSDQWRRPAAPLDMKKYADYLVARQDLLINMMKVMADNKLDAIVCRTVEHSPTLIEDGIKPPYPTNKGVPILNTFLVYIPVITVPSGFTLAHLPTGVTFMGSPYSDATMIKLAYAYEQSTHHREPPTLLPELSSTSR